MNYMRSVSIFLSVLLLVSCDEKKEVKLPPGFDLISQDGSSYFILVNRKNWGNKVEQRYVGREICNILEDDEPEYCEVYYFSELSDIPRKFPIMNRTSAMGKYEQKYGKKKVKYLPEPPEGETDHIKVVTFFKNIYNNFFTRFKRHGY